MNKGTLIVIDGMDGVGKSTTERKLHKWMPKAIFTHEPFVKYPDGKPYHKGQKMYKTIQSPDFKRTGFSSRDLFAQNAKEHEEKVIRPALRQGKTVVCDRALLSSLAYQGHYHKKHGKIIDTHHVLKANQRIQGKNLTKPDMNIYLYLPRKVERQRLNIRTNKHDQYDKDMEDPKKQLRLRKNYQYGLHIMKHQLGVPYRTVDANKYNPTQRANIIFKDIQRVQQRKQLQARNFSKKVKQTKPDYKNVQSKNIKTQSKQQLRQPSQNLSRD